MLGTLILNSSVGWIGWGYERYPSPPLARDGRGGAPRERERERERERVEAQRKSLTSLRSKVVREERVEPTAKLGLICLKSP
jgi:hypothetical protein